MNEDQEDEDLREFYAEEGCEHIFETFNADRIRQKVNRCIICNARKEETQDEA